MATNRIKGLTVEIGGDTTKLGEALKNVEAKSRSLSSELGSINKLLKLDPTNTDLLAQKQQVLAEAISSTREKLDTLKAAEQQVQEQFARGEVSAEQYRELQRQVTATENKLKKYEEVAKDTAETIAQLGKGTKTAEQRTKELADRAGLAEKDLDKLKDKAEETANKGLKVMAASATAVVAALTASAEATREYRTNMGKLNVAFTDNGHSVGEAAAAYQELVGVIGESDRSVETANHLAKLTNNAEDLSAWYGQILPGVFATFGDSLPLEGLTEAANETAKVAQITGPLADAINWATTSNETWAEALGDNSDALAAFQTATAEGESAEDAFNAALLACSNEQERQSLITKALTRLYGSAADAYKDTNAEIIRANKANDNWTASLARTGAQMEPVITDVKEMGTELLRSAEKPIQRLTKYLRNTALPALQRACTYVINNGPAIISTITGLTTAMAAYKVGATAAKLVTSDLTKVLLGAEKAQKLLNLAQAATPWGLALAGVAAVTTAIIAYCATSKDAETANDTLSASERELMTATQEASAAFREQKESADTTAAGLNAQLDHTQKLAAELETLADASGYVQEADQARAEFILGQLNDALGTEYTMVNGQIQSYDSLRGSVEELIAAKRAETMLDIYKDDYAQALKNEQDALEASRVAWSDYTDQLRAVSDKETEYAEARKKASETASYYADYRAQQLAKELADEKATLAEKKSAWEEASGAYGEYAGMIQQYEDASAEATQGHYDRVSEILRDESYAYGNYAADVGDALGQTLNELEQTAISAGMEAERIRKNFEDGVEGYTQEMVDEADRARDEAFDKFAGTYDEAYGVGRDMGDGMLNGMESRRGGLLSKVKSLVSAIFSTARREADSHSPSRKMVKVFNDIWAGAEVSTDQARKPLADATAETVRKMMDVAADAGAPSMTLQTVERRTATTASTQAAAAATAYNDKLDKIINAIEAGKYIMLDGDTLVGKTVDRSNVAMGRLQTQDARNVR